MSTRTFDGEPGDNAEAIAFVAALNAATDDDPLPVDPDDIGVWWWGTFLYASVAIPALDDIRVIGQLPSDLEVAFWPQTPQRERGIELGWGNGAHPLDAQVDLAGGQLQLRDNKRSPEVYATLALSWIRSQLARPMELQCWEKPTAYRVVLLDSGDMVGSSGLRLWRQTPSRVKRLS